MINLEKNDEFELKDYLYKNLDQARAMAVIMEDVSGNESCTSSCSQEIMSNYVGALTDKLEGLIEAFKAFEELRKGEVKRIA